MGKTLPKWTILVGLLSLSLVAFGAGNLENSYSLVWSETAALDADAYYGVEGPFDLDGDGYDEFIGYTDDGGMTLHLYENDGDNSFTEKQTIVISKSVYSYCMTPEPADLNGDGVPELIFGGRIPDPAPVNPASIFIYQLDTLAADVSLVLAAEIDPTTITANTAGGITKSIVATDIDADGVQEMILSLDVPDAIAVISLDPSTDYDFPSWVVEFEDVSVTSSVYEGIVVGDFDNDGSMNFAAVEWNENGTAFYDVNGADDYSLNAYVTGLGGDGPTRSTDAVDIDGDGFIEIITADDDGILWIIANTGDLSAPTMNRIYTDTTGWDGAEWGNQDVWRGTADGGDFYVGTVSGQVLDFEWDGVGSVLDSASWTVSVAFSDPAVNNPKAVTVGDFDDDGLDDIIFVSDGDATAYMLEHDGWDWVAGVETIANVPADTNSVNPVTPGYQTRGLDAGSDVDQDGLKEVIITDYQIQGVHIYEATADNTLEWVATLSNSDSYGSTPTGVIVADLDGNDREEIIFMCDYGNADPLLQGIQAWEWDGVVGSDTYTRSVLKLNLESTGAEVDRYRQESHNLEAGDVDGDGVVELVFMNDGSSGTNNDVFVIASVDGTFESGIYDLTVEWIADRTTLIGGSPARGGPAIADLDGDGTPEVVFNNWDHGAAHIIQSIGADSYEWVESFDIDSSYVDDVVYGRVHVTDIDEDGKDDVIGGLYDRGWLWWLHGSAEFDSVSYDNGKLTRISDFGAPWAVTGGDVTGDGVDEIFSVEYGYARLFQWTYKGGMDWDMEVVANYNATMGGFALDFGEDIDGDGFPEVVQGFLEPAYDSEDNPSQLNPMGYTFAVHEFGNYTTDVDAKWTVITPSDYKLSQNYPNPFNPTTTIEFTLPLAKDNVNLTVYNMLGQEVIRLVDNASYGPGSHSVNWNSLSADGTPAAAGVYIYELRVGNVRQTAKMTLIK
ncbi:MAG: T9SS type A sorting domain-containing protein [Candidatus Marinimicrobia bacterium]|nr:T9SS type A sorting domain-containing protein [Candidatus Neomarinimicrobiota bacterium]MCF7850948.1 T9SS type A sorting domain-containing protein [Candidatus Neomarinimicrobiota bacterium]